MLGKYSSSPRGTLVRTSAGAAPSPLCSRGTESWQLGNRLQPPCFSQDLEVSVPGSTATTQDKQPSAPGNLYDTGSITNPLAPYIPGEFFLPFTETPSPLQDVCHISQEPTALEPLVPRSFLYPISTRQTVSHTQNLQKCMRGKILSS